MEMMVYCFSCQILLLSSFVSMGATLAPVTGFTAGCCHQKCLCYLNLPQEYPFLQQNGKGAAGISQSLTDLLLKGQGGFGTWSGQLSWHSGVVTASPANLWLFQLSDIYPVLPLEDKGTVSFLQYTQTVQCKRVMVGICFSSEHLAQNALNLFKLVFWVVRMQKPAPVGSWEHELLWLGVEAAVCIS